MPTGSIRVGVSGWTYASWRGEFYPEDLPRRRELEYASRQFGTIEINGSFYSLLKPETYRGWYDATPAGFRAVKGSRFITHNKKLGDVETPLANFLASGVLALKEKLGPILWQLPEDRWAERIRLWATGREPKGAARITDRKPPRRKTRDVYVYFDNDQHPNAPTDAARLVRRLDAVGS